MTAPNPSIPSRADVAPADERLEAAAAVIAEAFCENRGFTEAPLPYHRYLQAEFYDRLCNAVLDEAVETPGDFEANERLDAAVERGAV
jgi:hypothetical protein